MLLFYLFACNGSRVGVGDSLTCFFTGKEAVGVACFTTGDNTGDTDGITGTMISVFPSHVDTTCR